MFKFDLIPIHHFKVYNDTEVTSVHIITDIMSKLKKHLITHSSIDNIDQETDTLSIHFTNSNLFQPHLDNDEPDQGLSIENKHPGSTEEIHPVELNHLIPPPKFPNFVDTSNDMVSKRFNIDIIWSITGDIPDEICNPCNIPLLGLVLTRKSSQRI